eukprot:TRINITY_DN3217_c0_g1_i6.p1 TRINITY_DN3217_c0_g1~~TRINITY_DN3217_c0_g1_i6.p1  ORF type:complete len:388 (-),score=86.87 TRINITY_DN3217_c0_g1_i6:588-1751(-)
MHAALDDFASGHFQHLFVAQGETDQSSCPSCGDEKQPEAVEAILDGFQLVSMVYLFNSLAGFRFQKRLLTEIVSAKVDPVLLEAFVSLRFKDLSFPVPSSFIKTLLDPALIPRTQKISQSEETGLFELRVSLETFEENYYNVFLSVGDQEHYIREDIRFTMPERPGSPHKIRRWFVEEIPEIHQPFELWVTDSEVFIGGKTSIVFDYYGNFVRELHLLGPTPKEIWRMLAHNREIFVANYDCNCIGVFDLQGSLLRSWSVDRPKFMFIQNDLVYVSSENSCTVYVFNIAGDPIVQIPMQCSLSSFFVHDGLVYSHYGIISDRKGCRIRSLEKLARNKKKSQPCLRIHSFVDGLVCPINVDPLRFDSPRVAFHQGSSVEVIDTGIDCG